MGRIEMLMQFVEANPQDPFPRYGLAMELKNAGRLEDAERAFNELMNRFPDYTPAYLHAGNVLKDLSRVEDAMNVYRAGIEACARKRDDHARGELESALAAVQSTESS
jgi:tetratricopeptide (TPR) repeat protein